jgi:hypothetical protein
MILSISCAHNRSDSGCPCKAPCTGNTYPFLVLVVRLDIVHDMINLYTVDQ